MSGTSSLSSPSNVSLHPPPPPPPPSSLNSSLPIYKCFDFVLGSHIFTSLFCTYVLFFLPLCLFILRLACQRRSVPTTTTSNSDLFTYNIVAMEMIGMLGSCFYCYGTYADTPQVKLVGVYVFTIITPGQMFFHILTCMERYLAVICPILYLGLRKTGGVRARNISIVCVWVTSCGWVGLTVAYTPDFPTIPFAVLLLFSVIVTSFCSLSVLRALIRPGPGEGGGDREDRSKRRAFHTIVAITAALLLRLGGQLLCLLVETLAELSHSERCLVLVSGIWSAVPSSYVLPLLFLHRAGKLPCFKYNTESGRGSE